MVLKILGWAFNTKNMNGATNTKRWLEIAEFLNPMGFSQLGNGIFWHMYFGDKFIFDLSASGTDRWQIMANVFKRASEFGEAKKLKEIQDVLGCVGKNF